MIGCGHWGRNHVRVWNDLGCLRAAYDPSGTAVEWLKSNHSNVRRMASFEEVLEDSGIDALVISTPASTHHELTERALSAGKDVLVEKPMALDVESAERVRTLANQERRVLSVGHVLEHHPAVGELRRLISSGGLGDVLYLYSHRLNLGRIRTEENALWSFAPHDIALILRLLGKMPTQVSCHGGAYLNPDVADVTLMSMTFGSGQMAHVFVSWLHPFKVQRFVIVGSDQMAEFDDTQPWDRKLRVFPHKVELVDGEPPVEQRADADNVPLKPVEPLVAECKDFLACVIERRQPLTDASSGIDVLKILEAGQRSMANLGAPEPLR